MIFKIVTDFCGDQVGPYFETLADAENYRDAEIDQDDEGFSGVDIVECKPKTKLPSDLRASFDWLQEEGELAELANSDGRTAEKPYSITHLRLRDWLRS